MAETPGRLNIINRDEFPMFQKSPITDYQTPIKINSVKFERFSPDDDYAELVKRGDNIDITNPEIYVSNKSQLTESSLPCLVLILLRTHPSTLVNAIG